MVMIEWKINQLLFAYDVASVVDWEEKLSVGRRIWTSVGGGILSE